MVSPKLYLAVACILALGLICPVRALTDPVQTKTNPGKGIKVVRTIRNGKNIVDVDFPRWAKPKQTIDMQYRLSVLPRSTDRNYTEFFVVPSKGVIVPVIKISKSDSKYAKALKGQIIDSKGNDILTEDINKGILHYPGTPTVGAAGMWRYHPHTSEFYHYKTPYATIGQAWAWLDPVRWEKTADQFYYYKKLPDGWMMYIYDVTQEKRIVLKEEQRIINGKKVAVNVTSPEDQKILRWDKNKSQVAIVWCADFGTDRDRWLTVGTLIRTQKISKDWTITILDNDFASSATPITPTPTVPPTYKNSPTTSSGSAASINPDLAF